MKWLNSFLISNPDKKGTCGNGGDSPECLTCEKKAGWAAVYANLALALFKAVIGYLSGSKALLGDALFSFKDCIASLVVVIGVKISGKPADDQHPYGHGKVEYVVLFLISAGLIISTIILLVNSGQGLWRCFHGGGIAPKVIAFWAALISVAANYQLAQYLRCVGDKLRSPSMLANARHNQSNAISSTMVAIAVLGAHYFGMVFLDPLVALVEAICLISMSIEMFNASIKGLFDSAAPAATVERIVAIARSVPGVSKVAKVVARHLGQGIWIEMTIKIDHTMSHQEGYLIGQHVKESIQALLGKHATVNVLFEPYIP
jgi:cation diffusion facilitator family transporter